MSEPATGALRRRVQMLLIAALFVGPLALAFWSYYGAALRPTGRTNHGDLVSPAHPLPDAVLATLSGTTRVETLLHGRWSLIYLAAGACDADCRTTLDALRRIRAGLGADTTRVQRVLLVAGPCCDPLARGAAGEELAVAHLDGAAGAALLAAFPAYGVPSLAARRVYLVDPLGNLLMSYAPGAAPEGITKDLERLLKLSHIG